jgi:hypothetical protein
MGVFIFLALVSGVSAYSCALQLPNQEKVLPALKISGLNGSGSLAVSSSSVGEAVDFVAILKNQGPFPVHDLRLVHVEPAEYFIERVCWQQGGKVSCQNVLENSATIRPVIEGGQSFTIWGVIRPARAHEKGKVTAVLSWVDESGNTSDIGITLGDFASQNWYEHWGLRFYGFVKDFALFCGVCGYVAQGRGVGSGGTQRVTQRHIIRIKGFAGTASVQRHPSSVLGERPRGSRRLRALWPSSLDRLRRKRL